MFAYVLKLLARIIDFINLKNIYNSASKFSSNEDFNKNSKTHSVLGGEVLVEEGKMKNSGVGGKDIPTSNNLLIMSN